MRIKKFYNTKINIKELALNWACKKFRYVYQFRNNGHSNGFENKLFASDHQINITSVDDLSSLKGPYISGWISYDVKNKIEVLESQNKDSFNFDLFGFIKADVLIDFNQSHLTIHSNTTTPEIIFNAINNTKMASLQISEPNFSSQTNKEDYLKTVKKIQQHIEEGDIYEACYCMELTSKVDSKISPVNMFNKLCKKSPKPFANFIKVDNHYLLGASPERFIKKKHQKIISQPIKGTIKRGRNKEEDEILKKKLFLDPKERAENLMIVDLVRNDLSRISKPGTVKVDELFGIYSFPYVHQMISTVSSSLKDHYTFSDIIKGTFPMGSMTGAPKIKAMELIDNYETFSRGLYSGTVGYFTKDNGFDFNVVIRSLQYNSNKSLLGLHVGSAITYDSIPEKEYDECMTKAKSVQKIFSNEKSE